MMESKTTGGARSLDMALLPMAKLMLSSDSDKFAQNEKLNKAKVFNSQLQSDIANRMSVVGKTSKNIVANKLLFSQWEKNKEKNQQNKHVVTKLTKEQQTVVASIKKEFREEFIAQANRSSLILSQKISHEQIKKNQWRYIDRENMKGEIHVHDRDRVAWERIKQQKNVPIHVFLPGYATGDRYTAIFTMLCEPRLRISLAYQKENKVEEKNVMEAYDSMQKALAAQGHMSPAHITERLSMLAYKGDSLREARLSLSSASTRSQFELIKGNASPLSSGASDHVFHISITTAIMAEYWGEKKVSASISVRENQVRTQIGAMISKEQKVVIDKLVDSCIAAQKIKPKSIGLWIANRPNPDIRQAEAIANPNMFEQIQQELESVNQSVFYIADGFDNTINGERQDRHPYKDTEVPSIFKFWEYPEIKCREDQWYFVDQLLNKTESKALIGIRSGALEIFALLGHNVIYLEHKDMFTPERHASWQGRIPYNRLITERRTGYFDAETEIKRDHLVKVLLEKQVEHLAQKIDKAAGKSNARSIFSGMEARTRQMKKAAIDKQISDGVLHPTELSIVRAMVETKKPAFALK